MHTYTKEQRGMVPGRGNQITSLRNKHWVFPWLSQESLSPFVEVGHPPAWANAVALKICFPAEVGITAQEYRYIRGCMGRAFWDCTGHYRMFRGGTKSVKREESGGLERNKQGKIEEQEDKWSWLHVNRWLFSTHLAIPWVDAVFSALLLNAISNSCMFMGVWVPATQVNVGMQVNASVLYLKLKGGCDLGSSFVRCQQLGEFGSMGSQRTGWASFGDRCGRDPRYVYTGIHMCMCLSHY